MADSCFLAETLQVKDFVLPEDQRPHSAAPGSGYGDAFASFPEIDFSQPDSRLVSLMHSACSAWGFFRIFNHGIPQLLLDKISFHSLRFFQLPLQQKLRILKTADPPMGYSGSAQNASVKSWSEALHVLPGADRIRGLMERIWTCEEERENFSADLNEYLSLMSNLAQRIVGILFCGLGVDPLGVTRLFEGSSSSTLRINYYPPCPVADLTFGSPPHKDYGVLSILHQDDVGGLEVFKDGQWVAVKPEKGFLIVNVGDLIQVLSNGKYMSVLHRSLVNSKEPRLSFAFFLNPSMGMMIAPVEKLVTNKDLAKYKPFLWEEYQSTFQKAKIGNHSPTQFFKMSNLPILKSNGNDSLPK